MMLRNSAERWGAISQLLHWSIVLLILGLGVIGLVMVELPRSPRWFWVYDLHKSFGLTVLALVTLRLLWRLFAGAPRPVAGTNCHRPEACERESAHGSNELSTKGSSASCSFSCSISTLRE